MAYIGNTVNNQGFAPAIDYFSGNGSTVTFTLSRPIASVAQVIVAIDNVIQNPSSAFTVSGNSITFTSAPLSGTNNIWVEYTSLITTYNAISQDPSVIGDITASGGFLSTGDFGNTFTDGTIVDYVTGNARITTGPADGLTIYNGGTSARTALMTLDSSGNVGIGTTSPNAPLTFPSTTGRKVGFYQGTQGYSIGVESSNFKFVTDSGAAFTFNNGATYSSATEYMRIDSSGYITNSANPAFIAVSASGSGSNGNGGPIYTSVSSSRGPTNGGYSTSTGYFTAPVTGWYTFAWCYLYQGMTAGAQIDDGYKLNSFFYFGGNRYLNNSPVSYGDSYVAVKGAVVVKLIAGDTFTPAYAVSGGGSWTYYNASNWGFLSGALIG